MMKVIRNKSYINNWFFRIPKQILFRLKKQNQQEQAKYDWRLNIKADASPNCVDLNVFVCINDNDRSVFRGR